MAVLTGAAGVHATLLLGGVFFGDGHGHVYNREYPAGKYLSGDAAIQR